MGKAKFVNLTCDLVKTLAFFFWNDLFTLREGGCLTARQGLRPILGSGVVTGRFLERVLYVVLVFKIWEINAVFIIPKGNN